MAKKYNLSPKLMHANNWHKNGSFDVAFTNDEVKKLKQQFIAKYSKSTYYRVRKKLLKKWPCTLTTLLAIVSGKNYLLPLIAIKTKEIKPGSTSSPKQQERTAFRLAKVFDVKTLDSLKQYILSKVKGD